MWDHQNGILHKKDNIQKDLQDRTINKNLTKLYSSTFQILPHTMDCFLISLLVPELLKKTIDYNKFGVNTTTIAISRHKELRGKSLKTLQ
jgi:hypothetical protein